MLKCVMAGSSGSVRVSCRVCSVVCGVTAWVAGGTAAKVRDSQGLNRAQGQPCTDYLESDSLKKDSTRQIER